MNFTEKIFYNNQISSLNNKFTRHAEWFIILKDYV